MEEKEIITLCQHCRCIQTPTGEWLHNFKITHKEAEDENYYISHGICNWCMEDFYPEELAIINSKKQD
jgi:hypothetical protein